MNDAT